MRDGFEAVVTALWESLGLGRPRITGEGTATLRIDGRRVGLAPSPDQGLVVVTTPVGELAADPHRREEQLRRLLLDGLGTVMANRAALRLRGDDVEAVAAAPARVSAVPALRGRIEDLLHVADIHSGTLSPGAGGPAATRSSALLCNDENVIFRL